MVSRINLYTTVTHANVSVLTYCAFDQIILNICVHSIVCFIYLLIK